MKWLLAVTLPLVLAATVPAVEFMPADVRWSVRLDVHALQAAGILDACQDAATYPQETADLAALEALTGLRLERDLGQVVVCGTDAQPENCLAIIHGRFDAAKLLALAQTLPGYGAVAGDGPVVHQWTTVKKKRAMVACLAREDVLLVAGSVARIRAALASVGPIGVVSTGKAFLASGNARDLADWGSLGTGGKELAHVERMNMHLALLPSALALTATVHAGSWVRAEQLLLLARGGVRIARMSGKVDAAVKTALKGATLNSSGPDIDLALQLPLPDAQRLILSYIDKDIRPVIGR